MCNSSEIIVSLVSPMVETNISFWAITPTSGAQPLLVTFDGFLFRNGIEENRSDSAIVDGENVTFEYWGGAAWLTARNVTTSYDSTRGYHGHIYGTFTFNGITAPIQLRCRLRYNGNTAKNLSGC